MNTEDQLIEEFQGWTVQPSLDHYGTFHIPEIAAETEHSDACEDIDWRVGRLIEAAPDLFLACTSMLGWIRKARMGTLDQIEADLDEEVPEVLLIEALGKALGKEDRAECDGCGRSFFWESLDPTCDLHQRVAPGEPLPAGQCPACGALCHAREDSQSPHAS